ncbi:MAG: S49 family peptidase [Patescibacteria group bacterium]|nr:S49 family peptidase [Patescibacteria group bacterium]
MEQSRPQRPPLLTFPGFLISFLIILAVYLFFTSITGDQPRSSAPVRAGVDDSYEYDVIEGKSDAADSILSVPVQGIILTEPTTDAGIFDFLNEEGVTYGYSIKKKLIRAAEDPRIKAVMMEINSPGGTIPGAIAISDGIRYYQETTGNPVYSHITDLGASGAYWAAAETDFISADPGSTTGSIGVIYGPFRYFDGVIAESDFLSGIETENGISYRYFTAGQYKDSGSPYRQLSEEEQRHWQTSVNNEYERFVAHVSKARNLPRDRIVRTIKALAYENTRALELGLIDAEASREDAYKRLAEKAGLVEYNVLQETQRFGFFEKIFGQVRLLVPQPAVQQQKACSWCNAPLYLYDRTFSVGK